MEPGMTMAPKTTTRAKNPLANSVTPHDIGRMCLELAGWDVARAKSAAMSMLRRSPELARSLLWWALEEAFDGVLRNLMVHRSPVYSATPGRAVTPGGLRQAAPTMTAEEKDEQKAAARSRTMAGEQETARRYRLAAQDPALRSHTVHDWITKHVLWGMKTSLGEATKDQLEKSAACRQKSAAGHARRAAFELEIAKRLAKGKRVKQCLTNAQIQEIYREVSRA